MWLSVLRRARFCSDARRAWAPQQERHVESNIAKDEIQLDNEVGARGLARAARGGIGGHGIDGDVARTCLLPKMPAMTIVPVPARFACTQLFSEEVMTRKRVKDFHKKRVQSRDLQQYWRQILDKRDRSLLVSQCSGPLGALPHNQLVCLYGALRKCGLTFAV